MTKTRDTILNGAVVLVQPAAGFRAGLDSLLLAACVDAAPSARVLDLGCGAGGALLPLAWRRPDLNLTGVDADPDMVALCREGVAANAVELRCDVQTADACALPDEWENRFDAVMSNPPYFEPGRASEPGAGKHSAYIASLNLSDWLGAMLRVTRPRGTIYLIHRAAELATILARLDRRAGEITVLPIRPCPGAQAKRVLIRARKDLRRGPVRLLDGLTLSASRGGGPTPRHGDVLAGQALAWC